MKVRLRISADAFYLRRQRPQAATTNQHRSSPAAAEPMGEDAAPSLDPNATKAAIALDLADAMQAAAEIDAGQQRDGNAETNPASNGHSPAREAVVEHPSTEAANDVRLFETLHGVVSCFVPLLDAIASVAQAGYSDKPWGGVEVGGLLLGLNNEQCVTILDHAPLDCEHAFGSEFELNDADRINCAAQMQRLAASSGLEVIGWYRTSSKAIALNVADKAFADEFFPATGQVSLLIKRARERKPEFTAFRKDANHTWQPVVIFEHEATSSAVALRRETDGAASVTSALARRNQNSTSVEAWERLGLKQNPFALQCDASFWYPTESHRTAATAILQGIYARKACLMLNGAPGTGKTALLDYLAATLKKRDIEFAHLRDTGISVRNFFEMLATQLHLPVQSIGKIQVLFALQKRLISVASGGNTVALLIDDADRMPLDVLEEIDLLGNFECYRRGLFQIVMAGNPEFDLQLRKSGLQNMRQRIGVYATLGALQPDEVTGYLYSRLRMAGVTSELGFLSESVSRLIWEKTSGLPRDINLIASALLVNLKSFDEVVDKERIDRLLLTSASEAPHSGALTSAKPV